MEENNPYQIETASTDEILIASSTDELNESSNEKANAGPEYSRPTNSRYFWIDVNRLNWRWRSGKLIIPEWVLENRSFANDIVLFRQFVYRSWKQNPFQLWKIAEYVEPEPISETDLNSRIQILDAWLRSGSDLSSLPGSHLDLTNKELLKKDALSNLDLRYAQFRGAKLLGQQFGFANIAHADFRDADLSDADLSLTVGGVPDQFSGAELSRCKLPADVAAFSMLDNVTLLSQNAGKMYLTTILACVFVILTNLSTKDIQLISNIGSAELPALKVSVSTYHFFGVSPVVLFVLSVSTHLYLQRLWETMAKLPAIFPDGISLDRKSHPWLINDLIRTGFPLLKRKTAGSLLAWMQIYFPITIAYIIVPITMWMLFLRCLPCHDIKLSFWQAFILSLAIGWSLLMIHLNTSTICRDNDAVVVKQNRFSRKVTRNTSIAFACSIILLYTSMVSWYSSFGTPTELTTKQSQTGWHEHLDFERRPNIAISRIDMLIQELKEERRFGVPAPYFLPQVKLSERRQRWAFYQVQILAGLGIYKKELIKIDKATPTSEIGVVRIPFGLQKIVSFSAGVIVEDSSQLTPIWKPENAEYPLFPLPRSASILDNKHHLQGKEEALKKADYSVTEDEESVYKNAVTKWRENVSMMVRPRSFQGANLRFLHAQKAFLVNSDFRGSDLTGADFSESDLRNSLFRWDEGGQIQMNFIVLSKARLDGANLERAKMMQSNLSSVNLTGATLTEANLIGANLSNAQMRGSSLWGANLMGASLYKAQLAGCEMHKINLVGANLDGADLRGAKITGAWLIGAGLAGGNLSGSDLSTSDLSGGDLSGANFTRAIIDKVKFDGAFYRSSNRPIWSYRKVPKGWKEQISEDGNLIKLVPKIDEQK